MPRQTKTVNDKNTKQEILSAYQELLVDSSSQPITESQLTKIEKLQTTMLEHLGEAANALKQAVDTSLTDVKEKCTDAQMMIRDLHELAGNQKRMLEEEKQATLKEQNRQKEDFSYEFAKLKKRTEEELAEMKAKIEMELAARKTQLKEQEDELADLRTQAKTFDPRLQKGINDAVLQTTKDLKVTFDHERALLIQEAKMKESLLEQRVSLLSETIDRQKEEIDRLNQTATQATSQMTRIAERAVTKTPEPTPPPPVKTS